MEGRRNKKRKKYRKEEGIQGERRKEKKRKKKSSAGFKPVRLVETGAGGWKDWFHFSPLLSHTLCCCSAFSLVHPGPSAPH